MSLWHPKKIPDIWVHPARELTVDRTFLKFAVNLGVVGGDSGYYSSDKFWPTGGWPVCHLMYTGAAVNYDVYTRSDVVILTPWNKDVLKVVFKSWMRPYRVTLVKHTFGLFYTPLANYAEPSSRCAHFFLDTDIGTTWRARTWESAEEETDLGVTADEAFHLFEIHWYTNKVEFYIDGVLKATHTTQIPTRLGYIQFLARTLEALGKGFYNHVVELREEYI